MSLFEYEQIRGMRPGEFRVYNFIVSHMDRIPEMKIRQIFKAADAQIMSIASSNSRTEHIIVRCSASVLLVETSPVMRVLKALEVIPKLTPEVLEKIEGILGNKPQPEVSISPVARKGCMR